MGLDAIGLFLEATTLKRIPRMGWAMRGVPHVESVAEHSHAMTIVALVLADLVNASGRTAIVFGPYARLYPGKYRVNFLMKVEGNPGSGPLATVDVFSHLDGYPRAVREVTAADFARPGEYQPIALEFDLGQTLDDVEFRAMYGGSGEVWLDAIEVVPLAVQLPP